MMSRLAAEPPLSVPLTRYVSRCGRARLPLLVGIAISCAAPLSVSSPPPRPVPRAASVDYSRIETEVLAALNFARTDPPGTAASLDGLARYYDGKLLQRPTQSVPIQTVEGVSALREASMAVRSERPVGALTASVDLTSAARDHALDQQRTGYVGHTGSDGSSVTTRVARYGTWQVSISENIDYSPASTGTEIVQNLLIDDGVPDRGHRRNIYVPSARLVGIACGPHPRYTAMCVIVQAGGFVPK
jgi:uncharacterized protein YkwD